MLRSLLIFLVVVHAIDAAEMKPGPLEPAEALKSFQIEPGMRIELVAAEPLVVDPVAIAWDEQGRMYVVEDRGYPTGLGEGKPPAGVVALLEDLDSDGRYDKRTEFATGLSFPNGVMCWKGGVFVTCSPDIFYLKDTDGDGVADEKTVVLTGFSTQQSTQLRTSHPILGLDGWVYVTSGLTGGKVHSPLHPNNPPVEYVGDFRFLPDGSAIEPAGGKGQFGQSFDDFGRRFVCSNRAPAQHVVMTPRQMARTPWLPLGDGVQDVAAAGDQAKVYQLTPDETAASFHPTLINTPHAGTFTSACGVLVFRGAALGEDHYGNLIICEPAQNLVQRQVMEEKGATFVSHRPYEGRDFLASTDVWFRPVFAAHGPDGGLYICDMYRRFIDHPDYIPKEAHAGIDFRAGEDRGRIYRITRADRPATQGEDRHSNILKNVGMSAEAICAALESPEGWVRDTARRLLLERADPTSFPSLRDLVEKSSFAPARAAAFHTLAELGGSDDTLVTTALRDVNPGVREQALASIEELAGAGDLDSALLFARMPDVRADPSPRVRFTVATALAVMYSKGVIPDQARIAAKDADDPWTRTAVLGGIGLDPMEFARQVVTHNPPTGSLTPVVYELGRMFGASQPAERAAEFFTWVNDPSIPPTLADGAVAGLVEGLRSRGATLAGWAETFPTVRSTLEKLPPRWATVATDAQAAALPRSRAVALLGELGFAKSGVVLTGLLDPGQPAEIRLATVRALGRMPDEPAGQALVTRERWGGYTPALREAVIGALTANPAQLPVLLGAVERGEVPRWAINPVTRNLLLAHGDAAIQSRAKAVFQGSAAADRQKVYEEFKTVLSLKPDGKNGHEVFLRACASCHTYGGEGAKVGPDLTSVRNQPAETLLLHILIPEQEIYPAFTQYMLQTKDGRTLAGLIASESDQAVTLRLPLGQEETVQRGNIALLTALDVSLMPQELERAMTKQELADLIGFLKGQ